MVFLLLPENSWSYKDTFSRLLEASSAALCGSHVADAIGADLGHLPPGVKRRRAFLGRSIIICCFELDMFDID